MFLLIGMLLISFTSAFKVGEELDIKITCINGGYCSSESYCNINIIDPDENLIVTGQNMTNQDSFHNYTISPNKTGTYKVEGFCIDGEDSEEIDFPLSITQTGTDLTQAKAWLYITILVLSILLTLGMLFVAIKLPSKNKSDELTGYIIAVSNLKYVRTFLFGLCYIMTIWISYFMWMITLALLDFTFLAGLFKFLFYTLAISTFPLFPLYIYFTIANFVKDKDIADLLSRGFSPK